MLPYRVSNLGPLTYESGALPIALHGQLIREGSEDVEITVRMAPAFFHADKHKLSLFLQNLKCVGTLSGNATLPFPFLPPFSKQMYS